MVIGAKLKLLHRMNRKTVLAIDTSLENTFAESDKTMGAKASNVFNSTISSDDRDQEGSDHAQDFTHIHFTHAFQPIVDCSNQQIYSHEVLIRGLDNQPPPVVFEQVAPELLMQFDQYNRERALTLARKLGLQTKLNMNFSPGSVLHEDGYLVNKTLEAAHLNGLSPKQIVLEITEGEAVNDHGLLASQLNQFRSKGIKIAIDDFGAGYAGLNMLAEIQPELLKLDMALIRNINGSGPKRSIVRAILGVCTDLGIDVIAEGIESQEEHNCLTDMGVELFQGFLFAKPGFEMLPQVDFSEYR